MDCNKQTQEIGTGRRGPGRPKGSRNKVTATLKAAILEAAKSAGGGGEDGLVRYLTEQAQREPRAFLSLLGRVLPLTNDDRSTALQPTRIEVIAAKPLSVSTED